MRRSTNLDSTGKLEIGRYERTSAASRPAFLMTGVMNASLKQAGKWPAANERLNNSTTTTTSKVCSC